MFEPKIFFKLTPVLKTPPEVTLIGGSDLALGEWEVFRGSLGGKGCPKDQIIVCRTQLFD